MKRCTFRFDPATDAGVGAGIADLDSEWACPHEAHPEATRCIFHLSADERASLGIDAAVLTDRFLDLFEETDPARKRLLGADLPALDLSYRHLVGGNRHPVDLRYSNVDAISFDHTTVEDLLDLRGATIGRMNLTETDFTKPVSLSGATITDEVTATEARFEEEVHAENVTIEGPVTVARAEFEDDVAFDGAAFGAEADFQAASFDAGAGFTGATFHCLADFDEGRFDCDATFADAEFRDTADFRGAEFDGGANALAADAAFEAVTFRGRARFGHAEFGHAAFDEAHFQDEAIFQEAVFHEDGAFARVAFDAAADFDEVRFREDCDFGGVRFAGEASFRGITVAGEARHLDDNACFEDAIFDERAAFDDAAFTSANFRGVTFGVPVSFRDATFRDELHVAAASAGPTTYVDLTGADVGGGSITQPADHWVRYDLTRARIADVALASDDGADRHLFDYFRFLETDFDGFDFSAHRGYLERNDWQLHVFDGGDVGETYDVPATPEHVETTYLYAYNNAKATGDNDAAIEFAIHQADFRRRKNVGYVTDGGQPVTFRAGKAADVLGNYLWYLTCGYGYRLWRIVAASAFVVVTWAVLYALPYTTFDNDGSLQSAGALVTADGLGTLATFTYYSLVTFTTVGYGDINPENAVARALAVSEGVLGVLLAALVVFVLGRRVAV